MLPSSNSCAATGKSRCRLKVRGSRNMVAAPTAPTSCRRFPHHYARTCARGCRGKDHAPALNVASQGRGPGEAAARWVCAQGACRTPRADWTGSRRQRPSPGWGRRGTTRPNAQPVAISGALQTGAQQHACHGRCAWENLLCITTPASLRRHGAEAITSARRGSRSAAILPTWKWWRGARRKSWRWRGSSRRRSGA